jgi:hypothetical protein
MIEFGIGESKRETTEWYAVRELGAVFTRLNNEDCRLAAAVCEAACKKKTSRASYIVLARSWSSRPLYGKPNLLQR